MKTKTIASKANDEFKFYKSLLTSKGINKEKLLLLSGEKILRDFLKSEERRPKTLLLKEKHQHLNLWLFNQISVPQVILSPELFDELDVIGTDFPLLVVEWEAFPLFHQDTKYLGLSLVVPVGDPSNLGAILRSAEAFQVDRIILTEEATHPFLPKALKAGNGSSLRLEFLKGPALSHFLDLENKLSQPCYSLDMNGTSIYDFRWPRDCFIILGQEKGFPRRPQNRLHIPIQGVESLNVAVAASIALFSYRGAKA